MAYYVISQDVTCHPGSLAVRLCSEHSDRLEARGHGVLCLHLYARQLIAIISSRGRFQLHAHCKSLKLNVETETTRKRPAASFLLNAESAALSRGRCFGADYVM